MMKHYSVRNGLPFFQTDLCGEPRLWGWGNQFIYIDLYTALSNEMVLVTSIFWWNHLSIIAFHVLVESRIGLGDIWRKEIVYKLPAQQVRQYFR